MRIVESGLLLKAGYRKRWETHPQPLQRIMVAASTGIALLPSLARVVGNAAGVIPLKKALVIAHVFARPAGTSSLVMKQFMELLAE